MMGNKLKAILIAVLAIIFLLCVSYRIAQAQDDCVLAFDDDDQDGYYDTFSYTDDAGRDVCKVRVWFHDAEGLGAVFTESGEVNGYTAAFAGAHVDVWRSGSPYSISHTKVWVRETPAPPDTATPVPTTAVPPTEIPPVPPTVTPTFPYETPTGFTATPTGGVFPPLPPPPVTYTPTATPTQPGILTPPVIRTPPVGTETPGPEVPHRDTTATVVVLLPQTGAWDADSKLPLYFGIVIICGLLIVAARAGRKANDRS